MRLRVAMPVHPHFRDFAVFRLAEHRPAGVHPVAGAAAAISAAELGGEPGPRLVQLSRPERDLRLVQVVDLNCFTTNGASGAGHKACAQACAKAGVPLGVLSSDGTIYVPVSSKPGDPQNSKLEQFIEAKVKVTGMHRMVSGLHTIEIKTVSAAT